MSNLHLKYETDPIHVDDSMSKYMIGDVEYTDLTDNYLLDYEIEQDDDDDYVYNTQCRKVVYKDMVFPKMRKDLTCTSTSVNGNTMSFEEWQKEQKNPKPKPKPKACNNMKRYVDSSAKICFAYKDYSNGECIVENHKGDEFEFDFDKEFVVLYDQIKIYGYDKQWNLDEKLNRTICGVNLPQNLSYGEICGFIEKPKRFTRDINGYPRQWKIENKILLPRNNNLWHKLVYLKSKLFVGKQKKHQQNFQDFGRYERDERKYIERMNGSGYNEDMDADEIMSYIYRMPNLEEGLDDFNNGRTYEYETARGWGQNTLFRIYDNQTGRIISFKGLHQVKKFFDKDFLYRLRFNPDGKYAFQGGIQDQDLLEAFWLPDKELKEKVEDLENQLEQERKNQAEQAKQQAMVGKRPRRKTGTRKQ